MFGKNISVKTFHALLDYRPFSQSYYIVERSMTQLARHDTWVASMLTYLVQSQKRCGLRQNVYRDISENYVSQLARQLIEHVFQNVHICKS